MENKMRGWEIKVYYLITFVLKYTNRIGKFTSSIKQNTNAE